MKYILLIVIVVIVIIFGWLFMQRGNEIEPVRKTLNDFIMSVNKKENYRQYLHDNFIKIFEDDIYKKSPIYFDSAISSIDAGTGNYKVSTETGKTFEYFTKIHYVNGEVADLTVKLIKSGGKWLIYGIFMELYIPEVDKNIIKQTTNNLFESIKNGEDYTAYLHPEFTDIFKKELLNKYPDNFKKGTLSEDGDWAKSENIIAYSNSVSYGNNKLRLTTKLLKVNNKWLIYGISFE
jgi:hypothetical protein